MRQVGESGGEESSKCDIALVVQVDGVTVDVVPRGERPIGIDPVDDLSKSFSLRDQAYESLILNLAVEYFECVFFPWKRYVCP